MKPDKKVQKVTSEEKKKAEVRIAFCAMGIFLLTILLIYVIFHFSHLNQVEEAVTTMDAVETTLAPETSAPTEPDPTKKPTETEDAIYSYLQGPKSWAEQREWSGEWGESIYDGGAFGSFGCGLCCIANLYSSLTPYRCTPVHAYRYAKKATAYGGGSAISWEYLRRSLTSMGFSCSVETKPKSYQAFQQSIASGEAAIALVSSADSTCYWQNTPGHYVTLFLYEETTDKVFLADSGNPDHNRHWIALRKIYKSLKTASDQQYLLVTDYEDANDSWQHKSADGNWIQPE